MNNSLTEIRKQFISYFVKNDHNEVKSSSLIPHNDNSLLFTNAGMVQFKNVFLGIEEREYKKAVSVQKCLRAGGKHNDLDNVGYTARHHTFFEMLGNFSFGDYFKEQAIFYAYEFVSKVLGLSNEKLLVTVHSSDEEAYNLWQRIAGFSRDKIIKISTSDNFWTMGDTGPAGPCTEIFYDFGDKVFGGPPGSKDENGDRFTEIWNLVFMQYNQSLGGKTKSLKAKSVDTGMGLERIAAVMQGVFDNYDTDLFKNIISAAAELLKLKVTSLNKPSFKVISDHIRASTFLISDGVLPSNEGRGYVLRRIIRRAVRHGYLLGSKEPLFYKLVPVITELMVTAYPELRASLTLASKTIYGEEEKFNKTIEDGMKLLLQAKAAVKNNLLPGEVAFKLYDTYGFPLDLTEDILKKDNIKVAVVEFEKCMSIQKELSKKNWVGSGELQDNDYWFKLKEQFNTEFIGYDHLSHQSKALAIVDHNCDHKKELLKGEEAYVLFDKTPFYPEGGGQVGDKGLIVGQEEEGANQNLINENNYSNLWLLYKKVYQNHDVSNKNTSNQQELQVANIAAETIVKNQPNSNTKEEQALLSNINNKVTLLAEVLDTKKVAKDLIIHKVKVLQGKLNVNSKVLLLVNEELRKSATANHTATHLLFTALKKVLGVDVAQQGSLVAPNRLRADIYLNNPLTAAQIAKVENEVNTIILNNLPVNISFLPYKEAINKGVGFLMGEEYPEVVRVVSIGDQAQLVSKELCGGCHVKNTGEIGIFKILSESGIRSGVRRLEVATGKAALLAFRALEQEMNLVYNTLKANKNDLLIKINNLINENKDLKVKVNSLETIGIMLEIEKSKQLVAEINFINVNFAAEKFAKLKNIVANIVKKYQPALFFASNEDSNNLSFSLAISESLSNTIDLLKTMQNLKANANAKGGGNKLWIQGSISINNKDLLISAVQKLLNK